MKYQAISVIIKKAFNIFKAKNTGERWLIEWANFFSSFYVKFHF